MRDAYAASLRDPAHAHANCEEYRSVATLDRDHDRADRTRGRRIACPVLVLCSATGPLGSWYDAAGGPLALWREWAADVRGQALAAGHFFPEEDPPTVVAALRGFLVTP